MRPACLPLLVCPRPGCQGTLALDSQPLESVSASSGDIVEGGGRCQRCDALYPIVSGVLLATPDPEAYLREWGAHVAQSASEYGVLSDAAREYVQERAEGDGPTQPPADFRLGQQYDTAPALAEALEMPLDNALRAWLATRASPADLLTAWAEELCPSGGMAIDLGCGAGGLLYRLAPGFEAAFGLDLSFLGILLARRIALGETEPLRSYAFRARAGREVIRPLPTERRPGAEFLVGDATAPPFPDGLFDCVIAANLIDATPMPAVLESAARLLRQGGVLLLTDPFNFRDEDWPHGERHPREVVKELLAELHLKVIREADGAPWIWAVNERHLRLWFNWCAAAVKED